MVTVVINTSRNLKLSFIIFIVLLQVAKHSKRFNYNLRKYFFTLWWNVKLNLGLYFFTSIYNAMLNQQGGFLCSHSWWNIELILNVCLFPIIVNCETKIEFIFIPFEYVYHIFPLLFLLISCKKDKTLFVFWEVRNIYSIFEDIFKRILINSCFKNKDKII